MQSIILSKTIQERRWSICKSCKFYKPSTNSCGTLIIGRRITDEERKELEEELNITYYRKKLRLCGCVLSLKIPLPYQKCPVDKWGFGDCTKEEYEELKTFLSNVPMLGTFKSEHILQLNQWYKRITGIKKNVPLCGNCIKQTIADMKQMVDKYENG